MRVIYSPQHKVDETLTYSFFVDVVTVSFEKFELVTGTEGNIDKNILVSETDTFDFSGLVDGIADGVTTTLPVNPILSAKKENGILSLELLNFIGADATDAERFPEWQEV